ncbi:MAG: rhomboid family intramembrane serine protease [Bacteroidota bacterium]
MKTANRANITSTILLLATSMMYVLDSLGGGMLSKTLAIIPQRVVENLELWRLITFPFAVHSLSGMLSLVFSVYFLAPRLEKLFPKLLFPILLLLFVVSQGLATTFFFPKEQTPFSGAFGLSFFIMSLAVFTQPRARMAVWSNFRMRTVALVIVLMALSTAFTAIETITHAGNVFFYNTFSSGFGSLAGVITAYLYSRFSQLSTAARRFPAPSREVYRQSPLPAMDPFDAVLSEQPAQAINAQYSSPNAAQYFHEEYANDEERLNSILDKILEQGKSSLRPDEEDFLQEYSKRI